MKAIVVDREWLVRDTLKKKLQGLGYKVFTADTAENALNLCIIHDVDLIIAGAMLPEMSGFELIERITSGRKDLDVSSILLLERDEKLEEILGKRSGIKGFMTKPATGEALERCLKQLQKKDDESGASGQTA
jgi:DNA-binding response OmpR family regulator